MGSINITSGKINDSYSCNYSYDEHTEVGTSTVNVKADQIVHDDLRASFRQLVPHLAFICEQVEDNLHLQDAMDGMDKLDAEVDMGRKLDTFKILAFKVTGEGESESIVITGQMKLKNGDTLSLTSPPKKWEDEYQYINELRMAIEQCRSEVLQYHEGKKAPDLQGTLFEAEGGQPEEETA